MAADSAFYLRAHAIFRPLAEYLSNVPGGAAGAAALDSAKATDRRYWLAFWEQVDVVRPIITPQQRGLLPFLKDINAVSDEDRKDSRWSFSNSVPFVYRRPRIGGS